MQYDRPSQQQLSFLLVIVYDCIKHARQKVAFHVLVCCEEITHVACEHLTSATNILKHYWRHICLTRPRRFVTFYISALEILLLTYLLTYSLIRGKVSLGCRQNWWLAVTWQVAYGSWQQVGWSSFNLLVDAWWNAVMHWSVFAWFKKAYTGPWSPQGRML